MVHTRLKLLLPGRLMCTQDCYCFTGLPVTSNIKTFTVIHVSVEGRNKKRHHKYHTKNVFCTERDLELKGKIFQCYTQIMTKTEYVTQQGTFLCFKYCSVPDRGL